jgi:hypothetical protein
LGKGRRDYKKLGFQRGMFSAKIRDIYNLLRKDLSLILEPKKDAI